MEYGEGDELEYLLGDALDRRSMPHHFEVIRVIRDKNVYFLRNLVTREEHIEAKETLDVQYKKIRSTH